MSSRLFIEVRERQGLCLLRVRPPPGLPRHRHPVLPGGRGHRADRPGACHHHRASSERWRRSRCTEDELRRCKNYLKGRMVLQLEDPTGLLMFGLRREVLENRRGRDRRGAERHRGGHRRGHPAAGRADDRRTTGSTSAWSARSTTSSGSWTSWRGEPAAAVGDPALDQRRAGDAGARAQGDGGGAGAVRSGDRGPWSAQRPAAGAGAGRRRHHRHRFQRHHRVPRAPASAAAAVSGATAERVDAHLRRTGSTRSGNRAQRDRGRADEAAARPARGGVAVRADAGSRWGCSSSCWTAATTWPAKGSRPPTARLSLPQVLPAAPRRTTTSCSTACWPITCDPGGDAAGMGGAGGRSTRAARAHEPV